MLVGNINELLMSDGKHCTCQVGKIAVYLHGNAMKFSDRSYCMGERDAAGL
jgi:hypothetical protein